jgi:arylsulfatase A-like enzyme
MNKSPNIILIVCDTLGSKHMSLYGYHRNTTPNLDRLVGQERFVVYKRCFSTSCWTTPAHASLFTGLYPSEHGVNEDYGYLNDNLITLPGMLRELGYQTFGISSNGLVGRPTGLSRGFGDFKELERWFLFSKPNNRLTILMNVLWNKYRGSNRGKAGVLKNSTPFTAKALEISRKVITGKTKPFFLFINLMQTHHKYTPPKNFRGTWSDMSFPLKSHTQDFFRHYAGDYFKKEVVTHFENLYDEEVLFLDSVLGQYIEYVKGVVDFENTMIVITSDHGESFGEENHVGHIFTLHNPLTWVPLIIKYPSNVYGGGSSADALAQLNDIFATISEIVGSPFPNPESSVSLLSSKRKLALMEIPRPDIWMTRLKKINSEFDQCDFPFEYHRKAIVRGNIKKVMTKNIKQNACAVKTYDITDMRNEVLNKIEQVRDIKDWPR